MKKRYTVAGALYVLGMSASGWAQTTTLETIVVEDDQIKESSLADEKTLVDLEVTPTRANSLTDALSNLFFVDFRKSSAYSSEPYIRGRGTKGVPIYLEGMRLNAGHNDSTNLLNIADIETLEVYRGAHGATLGMGAMSGAVVAKFKEPRFNETSAFTVEGFLNASASFLSEEGMSSSLGASLYNDRLSFSLSGGFADFNEYENGSGDEVLHSGYETTAINGSVAMKTSDDSYVYARYMRSNADSEDPFSRYLNGSVWMYTDRPDDEGEYYFFGYKDASLAGLNDVEFQVYGNDLHYDYNLKKEATPAEARELYRESETWGAKASAKKQIGEHLFSFAGEYYHMDLTNGVRMYSATGWSNWTNAFGITGGDISSAALRLADDITVGKAFYKIAGSYEHVDRSVTSNINTTALSGLVPVALLSQVQKIDTDEDDNLFSIDITAGYHLFDTFVPYIKLSNATRTPYFNEAYGNNPSNGSQIPNQGLDNETVWGVDIGFDGKNGPLYYSSALYYQKYSDYIELAETGYQTSAGLAIKQFINVDEATIYGIEAMVGYNLDKDRFIEAGYVYTRGENDTYDQPLAYIAPQKLTLRLGQRRDLGLSWMVEEVMTDAQDRISAINGEVATPGYALTNLSVSYAFERMGWAKKTVIALELNNLFDKEYREHLDAVSATAWYLPDEPGINGQVSLKVQF
ncbi:TonB-dependent receptor [Desulfobulbus rhabdoformis]|uniref:TonB-dependent receptor plug domain-containing protein n=1 Tax=Desulfobulbus rhabdoformis TaxID=34032 RepID=UPI00196503BB|nr:TonB-dependent receptor [Desulfobulbus rhabdoformis]MBM9615076.1 TonB-dependent receptor [Desulfobulbus rhabdoformis]